MKVKVKRGEDGGKGGVKERWDLILLFPRDLVYVKISRGGKMGGRIEGKPFPSPLSEM